jgi:hypothetical protein
MHAPYGESLRREHAHLGKPPPSISLSNRKFKPNKPQNLTPHLGTDQNNNQQFPVLRPQCQSEPPCDATKYQKKKAN